VTLQNTGVEIPLGTEFGGEKVGGAGSGFGEVEQNHREELNLKENFKKRGMGGGSRLHRRALTGLSLYKNGKRSRSGKQFCFKGAGGAGQ